MKTPNLVKVGDIHFLSLFICVPGVIWTIQVNFTMLQRNPTWSVPPTVSILSIDVLSYAIRPKLI